MSAGNLAISQLGGASVQAGAHANLLIYLRSSIFSVKNLILLLVSLVFKLRVISGSCLIAEISFCDLVVIHQEEESPRQKKQRYDDGLRDLEGTRKLGYAGRRISYIYFIIRCRPELCYITRLQNGVMESENSQPPGEQTPIGVGKGAVRTSC